MPLPIEVNHVLGRRSLTLAYRDIDAPVVIGRSRECDVQIPSVAVGTQHCMLFVHEGQWLVQEAPGMVVTLNGAPIAGPVALKIGDIIGVGAEPKAPTIQVDPAAAAAGQTGPAIEPTPADGADGAAGRAAVGAAAGRVVRPPRPSPISGEAPPQLPSGKSRPAVMPLAGSEPTYESESPDDPEQFPPDGDAGETPTHDSAEPAGDTIDFGQPAAAAAGIPSRYRPRRAQTEDSGAKGMIALFVVVVIGLGALILWAVNAREANRAENAQTPTPDTSKASPASQPAMVDNSPGLPNIFSGPEHKPKPPAGAAPVNPQSPGDTGGPDPSTPATSPDPSATTSPADSNDPVADNSDPAWNKVRIAHSGPDPANAIMVYANYRQDHQDNHTKELAQFESDTLDYLWWHHILDLFNDRAKFDKKIEAKKTEIANQPPGVFHKKLETELAVMKQQRDAVDQELTTDYGYTLPSPPDVDDSNALIQLATQRDAAHFEKWKKNTLVWIREHNGAPPWSD